MAAFEDIVYNHVDQAANREKLSPTSNFLIQASKLGKSTNALKVRYFEKLLNFVRVLCLYIIYKNDIKRIHDINKKGENRVINSLLDVLYHFNIIAAKNGELLLNKKYDQIIKNQGELLVKLFDYNASFEDSKPKNIFKDFLFVKDLINKYRDNKYEFRHINKNREIWARMIKNGELDYEIRLAETLREISRLEIPNKIKSPFDEDYYTESGRNAFRNFTQFKFIDVFAEIVQKQDDANILDVGCGYGNYIDVLSNNYPMFQIYGIESQQNVYEETSRKFDSAKNVDIIHGDFFNYQFQTKFDVVLLNYVLFYFDAKEKSDLISKVKELLSENGSIIVCQYFSGIEGLKRELAIKQKELSLFKKIEMFYSNKILYANTLWNDTADTFSESVKWDEFMDIISKNDLKINRITNADKFYYSFFIELKCK